MTGAGPEGPAVSPANSRGTEAARTITVASAPCSYGAWELTIGVNPAVPDAPDLLDEVERAGYQGVDLGPVGFLGAGEALRDNLVSRDLLLAGGFLELCFASAAESADSMARLEDLLDAFDAAAVGQPAPRPTLADAGSELRRRFPGRAATDPRFGWSDEEWAQFAKGLAKAVARCRERGYEPCFHPHAGSYVEAVWEIERLLELSDIGLCFDTGHVVVGGGDPVAKLRDWATRVNQFHLKDVRLDLLGSVMRERAPVVAIWERAVFCELGGGGVQIDALLSILRDVGYAGWLVVEQDSIPAATDLTRAARDQAANRQFLRARGL
jgi:inosose dehydratase